MPQHSSHCEPSQGSRSNRSHSQGPPSHGAHSHGPSHRLASPGPPPTGHGHGQSGRESNSCGPSQRQGPTHGSGGYGPPPESCGPPSHGSGGHDHGCGPPPEPCGPPSHGRDPRESQSHGSTPDCHCKPPSSSCNDSSTFRRGNDEPYIVRGASKGNHPRLEIETLMKNEYQWSLFLQALLNIQKKGYKPKGACFQEIAGIHGLPYERWAGDPEGNSRPESEQVNDPKNPGQKKTQWQGYCYHSSVLFPTWHRVYILLIEQAVTEEAKAIADKLVKDRHMSQRERENWLKASDELRFPYWDWSAQEAKGRGLPPIFMTPTVEVLGAKGKKVRLDPNPVSYFIMNEIPKGAFDNEKLGVYFTKWKRTYRWAVKVESSQGGPKWTEDYDKLNKALTKGLEPGEGPPLGPEFIPISAMRDHLRRMYSFPATDDKKMHAIYWDYFASTGPQSGHNANAMQKKVLESFIPLENPHNSIHLDLGGTGTMGHEDMAGFDPIFFLHHCNVDRQQAIWEYVYPDYWLGKGYYDLRTGTGPIPFVDTNGSYQSRASGYLDENSPLPPFRKSDGKYWNSTDARGPQHVLETYSYPPMNIKVGSRTVTIDISKPTTLNQRKVYIAALQAYYADKSVPAPGNNIEVCKPPIFNRDLPTDGTYHTIPAVLHRVRGYRDFVVVGHLPQFAFSGSHRLELYVDGRFVNEISVFSRVDPERCSNCAGRIAAGRDRVRGTMGIPHAAIRHVLEKEGCNGPDTCDEDVIGAIKKHISARIVAPDGSCLAQHVAAHAVDSQLAHKIALAAEQRPVLELISSGVFATEVNSGELEPAAASDWCEHGAVLGDHWCHA